MNTGRYTLKSFLKDHNLDQIMIPEIQRDYVWQNSNVVRLLQTILDNSKKQSDISQGITEELLSQLPPQAREAIIREQEKNKVFCNIGFIYAYFDPELAGRFVLIDGQQRLTTMFLTLLALSVKEDKQEQFRRSYFKDKILKFDYKVRESSHDFILNFVDYVLSNKNTDIIKNEFWYFSEYENDVTIQSVLNNYQVIEDFIARNNLSLSYIEDYVEFWYFDTNKSEQGEELYLYMNSRGETVSPNESVKANLLKGLSDKEKHDWGTKWEEWQNLFWKHRGQNKNADKGIEEFLRWVKIIELTKRKFQETVDSQAKTIRQIKDTRKIELEGLTLDNIEKYYNALLKLIEYKNDIKFNMNWLTGIDINQRDSKISTIDYIKLMPILMFAEKYPNCNIIDIQRFARFFLNITRSADISKVPFNSLSNAINITKEFLDKNYYDISDISEFKENYKIILTDEEVTKLTIYKTNEAIRNDIEKAFRTAEDYKFCDGKIWFIWLCIDYDAKNDFDDTKLSDFDKTFENFKSLFDVPDDLLRRALLTKGNYLIHDGYSTSLESHRYSFINEESRWKSQLSSKNNIMPYKLLMQDFFKKKTENITNKDVLKEIIKNYLDNASKKDWIYYFVKEPNLLSYCEEKKICWSDEIEYITLLIRTQARDGWWCHLKDKITFEN